MYVVLDSYKKDLFEVEKLNNALLENNKEKNENAVSELKKEINEMEIRIIKAIHELTTEINKK